MNPKLLLFDIDGTLIKSGGVGELAMRKAASQVLNYNVSTKNIIFAGRTDRLIIADIISKYAKKTADQEQLINEVLTKYVRLLKNELSHKNTVEVLPGIVTLLQTLSEKSQFHLSLVTGNIHLGARYKLLAGNILSFFYSGAFADDFSNRNLLPPLAVRRTSNITKTVYNRKDIWVIGDTPKDIECGKANGYKTLAVETGGFTKEVLKKFEPDLLFESLVETEKVIDAIS